jgi:carbamoyl-phosphate synthase large subunit
MKYTIAVTGAGGGVGQSIIKSLYDTDYKVIALDGETLGAGLYAVPTSYKVPFANNPEYLSTLLNICKQEKVDLLFPGLDIELEILSKNAEKFKEIGTTVIVSDLNVVKISNDKQYMYDCLTEINAEVPFTIPFLQAKIEDIEYPVIFKQMVDGARSQNVFLVKNIEEFKSIIQSIKTPLSNFIVQEYIEGEEYTCGTINLDGECKGAIIMKRILRDGDTYKCFSVKNEIIEEAIKNIANKIKPFGACNFQLRLKNNIPYIFEINARCSGTTASRTLCGFNEPKMIADYLLKNIKPIYNVKELTILRYWNELVVDNEDVKTIENQKYLKHNQNTLW